MTSVLAGPKHLVAACPDECSLHSSKIGDEPAKELTRLREAGLGRDRFIREAEPIIGYKIATGTATRHLKHYREILDPDFEPEPERRASDVEILDAVIQSAWKNRRAWKPSLRDMLEAMSKKHQITGGSEASDLMALFDAPEVEIEPEEAVLESEVAILSAEERKTDDSDDLEA